MSTHQCFGGYIHVISKHKIDSCHKGLICPAGPYFILRAQKHLLERYLFATGHLHVFSPNTARIGGLHYHHVGVQNKRKFVHIVCTKMKVNSQRRKILLFLSTNMAAMTSHANHQYSPTCIKRPPSGNG